MHGSAEGLISLRLIGNRTKTSHTYDCHVAENVATMANEIAALAQKFTSLLKLKTNFRKQKIVSRYGVISYIDALTGAHCCVGLHNKLLTYRLEAHNHPYSSVVYSYYQF
jgi:hypothetical protein